MKDGRHIIWSNDIDYDDWKEDLEEQYPELTEDERIELMYELNGDYLDDERHNLNIQLGTILTLIGLFLSESKLKFKKRGKENECRK